MAAGAEAVSSEPKRQELIYAARISVGDSRIEVANKRASLTFGMAVTAAIRTGSRRIIIYFPPPLVRYKHESLRER